MKYLAAICLSLSLAGCATLKAHDPFRMPDGTLDVMKVLQYIQYGLEADCQLGMTPVTENICLFGQPAITAAMAIANRDPTGAAPSVRQALVLLETRIPEIKPYIDWALLILPS